MSKAVTFNQLEKTLNGFGFEAQHSENGRGHVIFRHAKTGAIVIVPKIEQIVRPIYVSNAAHQIANSGIATTSTFETRLKNAAKDASQPPP